MSDEPPKPKRRAPDSLLGDLESIRTVLDREQARAAEAQRRAPGNPESAHDTPDQRSPAPAKSRQAGHEKSRDEGIPMLDDVVEQDDVAEQQDDVAEQEEAAHDDEQPAAAPTEPAQAAEPAEPRAARKPPDTASYLSRTAPHPSRRLSDHVINALLDEGWRDSADEIMTSARESIQASAGPLTRQQTAELNTALRMRLDSEVEQWISDVLHSQISTLQQRLLAAIAEEMKSFGDDLDNTQ